MVDKELIDYDDIEYMETLQDWINELWDDVPFLNIKQRKLLRKLEDQLKEEKSRRFNLGKPSHSSVSVRPTRTSRRGRS